MELTTVVLVAVGVTAVIGAIKTFPYIWATIKGIFKFLSGLEKIGELPAIIGEHQALPELIQDVSKQVGQLSQELRDHMAEEERVRLEEKNLIENLVKSINFNAFALDRQAIEIAIAVFKQTTFNDPIAYYIVDWDEISEQWNWIWGNPAYLKLTGLTAAQARGGQYWDIVHPSDKDRVYSAAYYAGDSGITLEVDFICVNISTKEETPVRVIAAPIKNRDEFTVGYLGAIHLIEKPRN